MQKRLPYLLVLLLLTGCSILNITQTIEAYPISKQEEVKVKSWKTRFEVAKGGVSFESDRGSDIFIFEFPHLKFHVWSRKYKTVFESIGPLIFPFVPTRLFSNDDKQDENLFNNYMVQIDKGSKEDLAKIHWSIKLPNNQVVIGRLSTKSHGNQTPLLFETKLDNEIDEVTFSVLDKQSGKSFSVNLEHGLAINYAPALILGFFAY